MTSLQITDALNIVIGLVSDVLGLCSQFPINLIVATMIAGLAIKIVKKVKKAVSH